MKKTRPKTATNRTNESWNNKYFPIIPKQTNQTNKNILSQRNSNNNIIDQNDSILNEEFYSLINVWNDLGVTNEFRNQFKKSLSSLSNEEKQFFIENEIKNLIKFRENLVKFTNDVTQREKNIQLLRKFDEIVESTFPEGEQKLNDSILNDIINVIEALRYNSINCVNSLIKIRELSYYKFLNGKFNFKRINKAYVYNNDYLIKMKNDMNFLRNSNLGNYIDFTNGEIDPFLICCSPKKNNRNRKQDKISIPINDDLMKGIKQAKYYFIQDMMFFNIDEDIKQNKNKISFNFYNNNNSNIGFNNLYRSNNNNFNNLSGKNSFINKTSRINSAKTGTNTSFNKTGNLNTINLNNLNMNRTLYKLKVRNGEDKYNLMFLNGEQNFYKTKQLKNNMNQYKGNFQGNNTQNNNYIYDRYYNVNFSNNRIRIEREQIPSMSRDEFLKRLDSIGKDKEELNIDHSMSDFIEKNKTNIDKKKTKEKEEEKEEEKEKEKEEEEEEKEKEKEKEDNKKEYNEKIDNKNENDNIEEENKENNNQKKEESFNIEYNEENKDNENLEEESYKNEKEEESQREEKKDDSEIEEYQNEFENEENEKENEMSKLKNKTQKKKKIEIGESEKEENEDEDYGGFDEVESENEPLETNKNGYKIEYYKDDINNLIRILSDKNYIDQIPENEKELFNLSEESFYPNNLIKGLSPKILICYPNNENNENITALCNYSFSSLDKPITISINHLSSINYNDDNNSWASQIELLINFIKNNNDYDNIEINFNDSNNFDKNMKKLFTKNLNFEIDENNKKIIYKNPNSENEISKEVKISRYLSIKTASLISYSNKTSSNQFTNDKYINLFQIYCILNEKKNFEQFSLNDIGNKGFLIDIEEVKNAHKNNIIFSLNNTNLNSIKNFIQEKISNDINFEYLEYNGKDESDIILYNNIPPLRSEISIKLNKIYYNRIEDKLEILYDGSSNSKIYLIPTFDKETKIIIAELTKNLKKKIIEKNGNIYENFYDLYDKLEPDKENNSMKTLYIPSFSIESRLCSSHIINIENNINILDKKNNNSLYINSVDEFFQIDWYFEMNLNNNFQIKPNENDIIIKDMFLFGVFNEKIWDINRIPATHLYIITKDYWNKSN